MSMTPRTRRASRLGLAALACGALVLGGVGPASARPSATGSSSPTATCFDPAAWGLGSGAARGGRGGLDHSQVSAEQQRAIERRTATILAAKAHGKGKPGGGGGGGGGAGGGGTTSAVTIPVYVHVMRSSSGAGDVTDAQVAAQVAVLNKTYGGQESSAASQTGFSFTLAGTDRHDNDAWHADQQSTTYRAETRLGGRNALNIWLVDFAYLGIATFPWEYSSNPAVDGIRVHVDSLPGGSITNYDLGETATHEAGHWLGLYHTFQGGCQNPGDEVGDTPAQKSATTGCPEGRDSCRREAGLDPIHNYMDYSYDACYNQFTSGQTTRMQQMWTAYRA
jgi:hypothetical protein